MVAAGALAVLVAAGTGLTGSGSSAGALAPSPGRSAVGAAGHAEGTSTPIQHVIEIFFENQPWYLAESSAYFGSLYHTYAGLSQYYAICHPSLPNYLAVTDGDTQHCGSDGYFSDSDNNIFNLVATHGGTWKAYAESMPSNCYTSDSGSLYVDHHNPAVYYTDIASSCKTDDIAVSNLGSDFPFSSTPATYTFITPNMDNDGHDTSAAYASNWLSGFLPKILAEPWFSSTAIFLQFDESFDNDTSSYNALASASNCHSASLNCGGHIYSVIVSPYTLGEGLYTADASEWSVLCTQEWLLSLPTTGHEECTANFPAIKSLFDFSTSTPSVYPVDGIVTSAATGSPISGATVAVVNGGTDSTNAQGAYSFALSNGTYALEASASGYATAVAPVTVAGVGVFSNFSLVATGVATFPLSGVVREALTDTPVPNARLSAGPGENTTSNATGAYALALANGTYPLEVSAAGYFSASDLVTIQGAAVRYDPSLVPADYSLVLGVDNRSSGLPVANASVAVGGLTGRTGPTGTVAFEVANGTYPVMILATGYLPLSSQTTVAGAGATVSFSLWPEGTPLYRISGNVSVAPHGTPAPFAGVEVNGTLTATTDANGSFSMSLPNGSYALTAVWPGYPALTEGLNVTGSNGSVSFYLWPVVYPVSGFVGTGADATAVPNATVSLSWGVSTLTNARGDYTLEAPNGTYTLSVGAPGLAPATRSVVVSGAAVRENVSVAPAQTSSPSALTSASPAGPATGGLAVVPLIAVLVGLWLVGFVAFSAVRAAIPRPLRARPPTPTARVVRVGRR